MTTTRLGLIRAAAVAGLVALTCLASTARAQGAAPASEPETAPAAPAESQPAPAAPQQATSPAAEPASASASPVTEPPPAAGSNRTAWPWIIMGTGVALVTTAIVLQVSSVREDDKRESDETKLFSLPQGDPQRKALQDSAADHDKSASNSRTAALVVGTVGFLAIAGSVVWWFFEGGSSSEAAPASAKLKPIFTPSLQPGYAGGSLGASF